MRGAVGIVAGSGLELRAVLDSLEEIIPFENALGTRAAVEGHPGRFVRGKCGARAIVIQEGRLHFYEGRSYEEVVAPIDLMRAWGVESFILTNAAGGLEPDLEPGSLVAIREVAPFSPTRHWRKCPASIPVPLLLNGCDAEGRYFWMLGPNYETQAEIRALQSLGAIVVGMSTAPELYRCNEFECPAAVLSCVTNNCLRKQVLTHTHVLEVAARAASRMAESIRACVIAGEL